MLKIPELSTIQLSNRWRATLQLLLVCACAVVVAGTTYRSISKYHEPTMGELDRSKQGLFDFHNGIYYPALAMTEGYDPYGPEFAAEFPVTRQIPPYSPLALVLHWPLGWMPLRVAEVVYYLTTLGLLMTIGVLAVNNIAKLKERKTWMLMAILFVLASRSGHTTLFTAYFTAELVLGTIIALRFAESRPIVSGLGIALASIKPNFGIPLILLMAMRGNWRAVIYGGAFTIIGAMLGIAILLQHVDFATFIRDVKSSDSAHVTDDYELPVNTWTRVDTLAVVAKWTQTNPTAPIALAVMVLLMIFPNWTLIRLSRRGDRTGDQSYSGVLILSVGLSALYHHAYDALLLIPAAFSLLLNQEWRRWFAMPTRVLLAAGLMFIPWNYISAEVVLQRLNLSPVTLQIATSTSGVVLLVCCLVMTIRVFRPANQYESQP